MPQTTESTRNLSIRKPNNMEIFRQSIIDAIAKSMKALQITFLKTVTESIENITLNGLSYPSHTTFQCKVLSLSFECQFFDELMEIIIHHILHLIYLQIT